MFKRTNTWTIATAILTVLVYVELSLTGNMFALPLVGLAAFIAIILSILEKKYAYILLNILLTIIACVSYIVLY